MCIIFIHQNNDAGSKYKLIIAANRDEYLDRPAKPADYHPQHPDVLCGVDMQQGVEGGTWLGVSKSGRFSALTNYLADPDHDSKIARGKLVLNYLTGDEGPMNYLRPLQDVNYRGFNMLAGRVKEDGKIEIGFYSNRDDQAPRILPDGTNVLPCASLNTPWRKAEHGRTKFAAILKESERLQPDLLTTNLINLLSDTACMYPDPLVIEQCAGSLPPEALEKYCSIRIVDLATYGTRMQTVVLVDHRNVVHFTERTLVGEPTENSKWEQKSYQFTVTNKSDAN